MKYTWDHRYKMLYVSIADNYIGHIARSQSIENIVLDYTAKNVLLGIEVFVDNRNWVHLVPGDVDRHELNRIQEEVRKLLSKSLDSLDT